MDMTDTKEQLINATQVNAEKACKSRTDANDALKYTQAALNAAHAWLTLNTPLSGTPLKK